MFKAYGEIRRHRLHLCISFDSDSDRVRTFRLHQNRIRNFQHAERIVKSGHIKYDQSE